MGVLVSERLACIECVCIYIYICQLCQFFDKANRPSQVSKIGIKTNQDVFNRLVQDHSRNHQRLHDLHDSSKFSHSLPFTFSYIFVSSWAMHCQHFLLRSCHRELCPVVFCDGPLRVLEDGLTTIWNINNPTRVIAAGDRILEVNGEALSPED